MFHCGLMFAAASPKKKKKDGLSHDVYYCQHFLHSCVFVYYLLICMKAMTVFLFISDFPPAPSIQSMQSENVSDKVKWTLFCTCVIILFSFCLAQKIQGEDSEGVGC